MSTPPARTRLDNYANTALVVLAVAAVWLIVGQPFTGRGGAPFVHRPYVVGERLDLLSAGDTTGVERTLLIVFQPGCEHCEKSMSFYARLASKYVPGRDRARIVAMSVGPLADADAYLRQRGVIVSKVLSYPMNVRVRLTGTPTLLVVDEARHIRGLWMGRLSPHDEEEVESLLASAGQSQTNGS